MSWVAHTNPVRANHRKASGLNIHGPITKGQGIGPVWQQVRENRQNRSRDGDGNEGPGTGSKIQSQNQRQQEVKFRRQNAGQGYYRCMVMKMMKGCDMDDDRRSRIR